MAGRRPTRRNPLLSCSEMSGWYGLSQVLFNLDFVVLERDVVVLIGPNGAGKTTTLKSIFGLVKRNGEVRFDETRLSGMRPHEIASLGMGYVPEDRRVFPGLSVLENLEAGRIRKDKNALWDVSSLFDLFPNLAEARHRDAAMLSGGEQQMLAIARTLMGNPRLILLDEPSEGLAPVILDGLAVAIRTMIEEGITILMCEQNLDFAREIANRVIVMENGEIQFDGTIKAYDRSGAVHSTSHGELVS